MGKTDSETDYKSDDCDQYNDKYNTRPQTQPIKGASRFGGYFLCGCGCFPSILLPGNLLVERSRREWTLLRAEEGFGLVDIG